MFDYEYIYIYICLNIHFIPLNMNPLIRLQTASVTFGMKFGVQPQAVSMAMKRWDFSDVSAGDITFRGLKWW